MLGRAVIGTREVAGGGIGSLVGALSLSRPFVPFIAPCPMTVLQKQLQDQGPYGSARSVVKATSEYSLGKVKTHLVPSLT